MTCYLSIASKPTFLSGVSLNQHRSQGPIFIPSHDTKCPKYSISFLRTNINLISISDQLSLKMISRCFKCPCSDSLNTNIHTMQKLSQSKNNLFISDMNLLYSDTNTQMGM